MNEYKKLLRGKFVYLWTSQILSQLTVNIINFLFITRLFTITKSAIATSMLWIAYALPAVFVGPFGAASVDMLSKRKMLILTNIFQAITIFTYALIGEKRLFLPYGIAMIYSLINQFNDPAEASAVPALVRKKYLHYANGLFFLTTQAALILGFGISGLLHSLLGYKNTLFLCSGFLLAGALAVSFIPEIKNHDFVPDNFEAAIIKFFSKIVEGYRFIKNNKEILTPFLIMIGLQVVLTITAINVPIIASEIIQIDVNTAGVFIVIPAGLGAIFGSILTSKLLKKGWRKKKAIETFLKIVILVFLMFAFVIRFIQFDFIRVLLATVAVMAAGLGFVGILIPTQTFLQEKTPGGFRGRVFGNFSFLVTIATIFPVIFSGAITDIFGIRLLMLILALLACFVLFISNRYGQKFLENGMNNK